MDSREHLGYPIIGISTTTVSSPLHRVITTFVACTEIFTVRT